MFYNFMYFITYHVFLHVRVYATKLFKLTVATTKAIKY